MIMTHSQAVRRVAAWARNTIRIPIVISELKTMAFEIPDVLAFKSGGLSMLIEVKVSRSDFLADRNKSFRNRPEEGMGDIRYFAAPAGLLAASDIPEKWGLLEIESKWIRETVKPERQEVNKRAEVAFLMSALRRLELSTAVFVRSDDEPNEKEAA